MCGGNAVAKKGGEVIPFNRAGGPGSIALAPYGGYSYSTGGDIIITYSLFLPPGDRGCG